MVSFLHPSFIHAFMYSIFKLQILSYYRRDFVTLYNWKVIATTVVITTTFVRTHRTHILLHAYILNVLIADPNIRLCIDIYYGYMHAYIQISMISFIHPPAAQPSVKLSLKKVHVVSLAQNLVRFHRYIDIHSHM